MKRLIIGGIPCSATAWSKLFPEEDGVEQKIIPFFDVISRHYQKRNFSDLVYAIRIIIQEYKPDIVILHDIGVTLGLLALIKIKKIHMNVDFKPSIIIFNGAFRGFNILQALHPLKIQWMSYKSFKNQVKLSGGQVDSRFASVFSDLKHLYRQLVIISVMSLLTNFFKMRNAHPIEIKCPILILASPNDTYIPFDCMKFIERDFSNSVLKIIYYRHFPYSGDIQLIKKEIADFQLKINKPT